MLISRYSPFRSTSYRVKYTLTHGFLRRRLEKNLLTFVTDALICVVLFGLVFFALHALH